jgi:GNAT superfamily N-acetyltransferase
MIQLLVREAKLPDCPAMGRILVEATVGAFHGRVPDQCLQWLTAQESATNWARNFEPGGLEAGEHIFVAEVEPAGVIGLAMVGWLDVGRLPDPALALRYSRDLYSLQVDPAWQRRGVGRLLVGHCAAVLLRQGINSLTVRVLAENPNRSFYERLGAVALGELPYNWEGYQTRELWYGWEQLPGLVVRGELPSSTD